MIIVTLLGLISRDNKYAIQYADFVTQSFHPVKHITTGEGGAIINDKVFYDKINVLRFAECLKIVL